MQSGFPSWRPGAWDWVVLGSNRVIISWAFVGVVPVTINMGALSLDFGYRCDRGGELGGGERSSFSGGSI